MGPASLALIAMAARDPAPACGRRPPAEADGGPAPPARRATRALLAIPFALALAGWPARAAHAGDPCWMDGRHGRFPVCFDPGNRLRLDLATDGWGGAIQLRHAFPGDDPDVTWRLEHELAATRIAGSSIRATAYAGRVVRHSSDGHVVLPFGRPRKLFLPFDLGAEAQLGALRRETSSGTIEIGAVRTAALVELSRADNFRRRLAIGAVARWDLEVDSASRNAREHAVAPFSLAAIDLRAESQSGLTLAGLRAEAGGVWSTAGGWERRLAAEAELERVLLAVQDRPLSLFVGGAYRADRNSVSALVGVRLAPIVRVPRLRGR